MNTQPAKLKKIAIFLAAISSASFSAMAHAEWSIKGLGTLGGVTSLAFGINDSGQVVGSFNTTHGNQHAFITGPSGSGMTDLGTLGGASSQAWSINDSGQVVGLSVTGISATGANITHAFITGPNGIGMTDLGTLLGGDHSAAWDINDSGQVAGSSNISSSSPFHAFITGPNGIGMTDLNTLGIFGGVPSNAAGINNSGQVTGRFFDTARGNYHAFITGPNGIGITDIGTLGRSSDNRTVGINDFGQVVGGFDTASGPHAFFTGPNGTGMTDLGTLGGFSSIANGINNVGEVVGIAGAAGGELHSFIFSHGGITDLSLLTPVVAAGWTELNAYSINNNGQIAGYGRHNGHDEAFLLSFTPDTVFTPSPIFIPLPSPVPEPSTYAMLLAGLGLVFYRYRAS